MGEALSRLGGVLIVAIGGVAIFAATHLVLGAALGADAASVYPRQRPLAWGVYERIWARIAAIDELYHNGQLPANTRLGVCIGVSTTAAGLQRRYLESRATVADRWIVLTSAGLSFENIENVMRPVFFCSLKPSVVLFGVHPQMLVGESFLGDEPKLDKQVVGRRRALDARMASFYPIRWLRAHWAVEHSGMMAAFLRTQIYAVRLWVFYLAGVTADKLDRPATEPWDEDPLWLWNMDDADNHIAEQQIRFWTPRGHFKPENYDPEGAQARAFVRMIRAFRQQGAKVEVVIMPERSSLRALVPPNAKPCLYETLRRAFPKDPPRVIDVQDAMPDELFTDHLHLLKLGADRLSKLVADQLQSQPQTESTQPESTTAESSASRPATSATTPEGS